MREMKQGVISIIVPIYNAEKYLDKCIWTMREQSYSNLQIILVDDESPDRSGEICDRHAAEDKRIEVIHQKNTGVAGARNAGVSIAQGEYIAFVDPDDYIHPRMYEYLLAALLEQEADISICDYYEVPEDAQSKMQDIPYKEIPYQEIPLSSIVSKQEKMEYSFKRKYVDAILVWNKLYKRKLWENFAYLPMRAYEDEATIYQLVYKAEKLVYVNEKLYFYVKRNAGSITTAPFSPKRLLRLEAIIGRMNFYIEKEEWDYFLETFFVYKTDLLKVTETIYNTGGFEISMLTPYKKLYNRYCMKYLWKCSNSPKNKLTYLWYGLFPKWYFNRYKGGR